MHILAAVGVAFLALGSSTLASPVVSKEDAELMQIEALADRTPDRVHGRADYLKDEPQAMTTGSNSPIADDCERVPVRTKRSDGVIVTQRINMCD